MFLSVKGPLFPLLSEEAPLLTAMATSCDFPFCVTSLLEHMIELGYASGTHNRVLEL